MTIYLQFLNFWNIITTKEHLKLGCREAKLKSYFWHWSPDQCLNLEQPALYKFSYNWIDIICPFRPYLVEGFSLYVEREQQLFHFVDLLHIYPVFGCWFTFEPFSCAFFPAACRIYNIFLIFQIQIISQVHYIEMLFQKLKQTSIKRHSLCSWILDQYWWMAWKSQNLQSPPTSPTSIPHSSVAFLNRSNETSHYAFHARCLLLLYHFLSRICGPNIPL